VNNYARCLTAKPILSTVQFSIVHTSRPDSAINSVTVINATMLILVSYQMSIFCYFTVFLCVLSTNESRFARSDIKIWIAFLLYLIKPIENGILCCIPKSNSVSGGLRVKYRCGLIGIQPGIMNTVDGEFIIGVSIKSTFVCVWWLFQFENK